MGFNLFKITTQLWAVQYQVKGSTKLETNKFISPEAACDFLETLNVSEEEIEYALADMYGRSHTRAHFGINGNFLFSDDQQMVEIAGVA